MRIAALIQALTLIGRTYRNRDGSQPAEAVKKVLQQLDGAPDMTLAEWAAIKRPPSRREAKPASSKVKRSAGQIDEALKILEQARTQAALGAAITGLRLSAGEWQAIAKKLTGRSARSGTAALEVVEAYFSDRILLDERVESVKRQFGEATPPPADA